MYPTVIKTLRETGKVNLVFYWHWMMSCQWANIYGLA